MLNRTKTTRNNPFKRWPLRTLARSHTRSHFTSRVHTMLTTASFTSYVQRNMFIMCATLTSMFNLIQIAKIFLDYLKVTQNALVHEFYLMFVSSETWYTKSNISYPYLTFKEKCSRFVFHVKSSFYLTFMQNERFTSFTSRVHVLPHSYKRLIFTSYTSLQ